MKSIKTSSLMLLLPFLNGCIVMKPNVMPDDPAYAPIPAQQLNAPYVNNGSLYHEGFGISLYEDNMARRVGDILTVKLTESMNANSATKSTSDRKTTLNMPNAQLLSAVQNGLNIPKLFQVDTTVNDIHNDKYEGTGTGSDTHTVGGFITVTVSEIYPNGNLKIRGEKWISLNEDQKYVRLSGIVRPSDITKDNQIDSNKIADARIIYGGKGLVSENASPGWITRFFLSPSWPL